jgi:hypothetical protein
MLHTPREYTLIADGTVCRPTHVTFQLFILLKIYVWISPGKFQNEQNLDLYTLFRPVAVLASELKQFYSDPSH